jgi:urease accessory protein
MAHGHGHSPTHSHDVHGPGCGHDHDHGHDHGHAQHDPLNGPRPPRPPACCTLLWLASPALPVGGFSYSEGLEAAVDAGLVHDEHSAAHWLADQLHLGLARSDLAVVAQAIPAWRANDLARIAELNQWVLRRARRKSSACRPSRWAAPCWNGPARSARSAVACWSSCIPAAAPHLPGGHGLRGRSLGREPEQQPPGFAFGWAENMVQAAIKSVPLGQSAGQRMLARLVGEIPAAVEARHDPRRRRTPGVHAHAGHPFGRHETQYSRLFRS